MDQRIGIEFYATGVGETIRKIRRVGQAVSALNRLVKRTTQGMTAMTTGLGKGAKQMGAAANTMVVAGQKMGRAGRKMQNGILPLYGLPPSGVDKPMGRMLMERSRRPGFKRIPQAQGMTGAWMRDQAVAQAESVRHFKNLKPSFLDTLMKSPIMGAPGFMIRFMIWHAAFKAIGSSMKDLLLGGVRTSIDTALTELQAVSFTPEQQNRAAMAGHKFAMKTGVFTTEQYIQAMSQVASSLSIRDVGFEAINRGTQAAMVGAALSKMSTDAFGELLGQVRAATQGAPEFKGMSAGAHMEKITAQIVKAIEITQEWGTGFATAFAHSLPVFQNMGWSLARSLAFIGSYKTAGFKSGQIGRFTRWMGTAGLEPMSRLFGEKMGAFIPVKGTKRQRKIAKLQNEAIKQALKQKILQKLATDPDQLLIQFGNLVKEAYAKGIDLVKVFKIPQRWIAPMLKLPDVYQINLQRAVEQIGNAQYTNMYTKLMRHYDREGFALLRIQQAFATFYESLQFPSVAQKIQRVVDILFGQVGIAKKFGQMRKANDITEEQFQKQLREFRKGYGPDMGGILSRIAVQSKEHGGFWNFWATPTNMADLLRALMAEEKKTGVRAPGSHMYGAFRRRFGLTEGYGLKQDLADEDVRQLRSLYYGLGGGTAVDEYLQTLKPRNEADLQGTLEKFTSALSDQNINVYMDLHSDTPIKSAEIRADRGKPSIRKWGAGTGSMESFYGGSSKK